MTRLAQIIDGAVSDDLSVANLLRMLRVVASRLNTEPLETWVDHELNGYPDEEVLPSYRGPFPARVLGQFSGPLGSTIERLPIPATGLPEKCRDGWLFKLAFFQPIAEIQELSKANAENLQNPWPAEVVAMVNQWLEKGEASLVPMHGLVTAYRAVSPQQLKAVIDAVRSRVLNLALDLEKISPQAGEPGFAEVDMERVLTVVNNHIYGDGNNMSVGSPGAMQATNVVKKGDLTSLFLTARKAGLADDEVDEIREAIEGDTADPLVPDGEPGPRTQGLLGRLMLGVRGGGGKISVAAAGGVAASGIRAFFGLP